MIAWRDLFINSQIVRTDIFPLPPCIEKLRGKIEPYTHAYLSNEKVAFTRALKKIRVSYAVCNDDQTFYNINLCHARAKTILI